MSTATPAALEQQIAAVRQAVKDARREQEKLDRGGKLAQDADLAGFFREHITGLEAALSTLEAVRTMKGAWSVLDRL